MVVSSCSLVATDVNRPAPTDFGGGHSATIEYLSAGQYFVRAAQTRERKGAAR